MSPGAGSRTVPLGRRLPTAALIRGGVITLVGLLAAMATGRTAPLVIVLPLLAWTLLAILHRPPAGDEDADAVDVHLRRATVPEQGTTAVDVIAPPHLLLGTAWPPRPGLVPSPARGAEVTAGTSRLRITAERWGRYEPGPVHVVLTDASGAYRSAGAAPCPPLSVVPDAPSLIAPLEVPQAIGLSGPHLSRRRGDGTALADVRLFAPGDRLARINWRVTARTGRMHTNATFTEQDTDVLIVTDTLQEVSALPRQVTRAGAGTGADTSGGSLPGDPQTELPLSSLDVTVRATAAIARHYLSAGDRVAVHDAGNLIGDVRVGGGDRQIRRIVTALSRARRATTSLTRPRPLRGLRSGTLVVICTPLLNDQMTALIGDALAQGGEVIVIDTLPVRLGDAAALADHRRRGGVLPRAGGRPGSLGARAGDERMWEEAWVLRRLLRERVVRDLRSRGVPVTAWTGPGSLAPVLLSMAAAATAPRRRGA